MREIQASTIVQVVARLFEEANYSLEEDVLAALNKAHQTEESPLGKEVLRQIIENARIAAEDRVPLCQDCGTAVVFLELGQDAHVAGGDLCQAITDGVSQGYREGYLRKSIVNQPFSARTNTGDNTPPVIHISIVPGDKLKITALPKGGGAENMSRLAMLKPNDGKEGIIDFVVSAVADASAKPCPPVIVGVGIGGTSDMVMLLAKQALLRRIGAPSPDPEIAALEKEILTRINDLGIGPMGYGGRITALAVHVEARPAHIASLPVAVNLQCHSARHKEAVI
ncbi:MAG: fumarate hydratase [Dehalococcoidales bacterium]|nr:fumarate hydratase [Dehalococcoidales bacterium]